ncbi:MAG: N-6 DNA methylase [Desulfovibrionaceae bacterium]
MTPALSVAEAAAALGISKATVRNWMRRGLLAPLPGAARTVFDPVRVAALHEALASGAIGRLRQRANKSRAGCGPRGGGPGGGPGGVDGGGSGGNGSGGAEGAGKGADDGAARGGGGSAASGPGGVAAVARRVAGLVAAQGVPVQVALPVLALAVVRDAGLATPAAALRAVASGLRRVPCAHAGLARELEQWGALLPVSRVRQAQGLLCLRLPQGSDVLGLLYQHLRVAGDRNAHGAYYTPGPVAAAMAAQDFDPRATVLDPCCGTGQFLLAFAALGARPEHLYGLDSDPIAVRIARINLMLAYPGHEAAPRIQCANALFTAFGQGADAMPGQYERIVTNPPWGGAFSAVDAARLRERHPEIATGESFAHFLRLGMALLAPGGMLSYLLPEAVLHVAAHAAVRRHLLACGRIERVEELGRVFSRVFTPVIRMDVRKHPSGPERVQVCGVPSGPCVRALRPVLSKEDFAFNVRVGAQDMAILDKLYAVPHATLRQGADWALGIVTGDNARHLLAAPGPDTEPIIRGRDVAAYAVATDTAHIRFTPDRFQQAAPERLYRAGEKLVYRFVSRRLVVAHDRGGRLTLNSANCVIPRLDGYPVKAVLALFNSPPYRYAHQRLFGALKVLRRHLESLPLPLWPPEKLERLEHLANGVLQGVLAKWAVDDYVMHTFGLTDAEVERILEDS